MTTTPTELLCQFYQAGQAALAGRRPPPPSRPPGAALDAVTLLARQIGLDVILTEAIAADSREWAAEQAGLARATPAGTLILDSGTAPRNGTGRDSRTLASGTFASGTFECLLALGLALDGASDIWALACDHQPQDGATGAFLCPDSLARAMAAGMDPAAMLAGREAQDLFHHLGDLVPAGDGARTRGDFRAILVL
ncbi:hypothetical protein [Niveispirillum irakense]|uniref:hypothetical protein n=1 Tax=Niveispirillum irakense TaxID=34011 RepID=UPI00040ABD74|nr:hypothetical protein [Niveispirillum irakense]